jgi:hypothetical protein
MSTTPVETWQAVDGTTLGVIYPFAGAEGVLAVLLLAFWLIWHVLQMRHEKRELQEDVDLLRKNGNLERATKGDNLLL